MERGRRVLFWAFLLIFITGIFKNEAKETNICKAQQRVNYPREQRTQNRRLPFVTQFTPYSESIGKILCKHWYILRNAYPNIQDFKATPIVSYRRGRTMGNTVTFSNLKIKNPTTNTFLGKKSTGKEFVNPQNGKKVKLRRYYTCYKKFAIYVLTCPCGLIYIGETTQMVKSRISQIRSSINLGNMTLPGSKHFLEKGHTSDQLKFMVLENIPPLKRGGDRELKLKQREVWLINKLGSLYHLASTVIMIYIYSSKKLF
ncbi:hypothetical protein XELAEV_18011593mg [Xenopus laevis]|uniref:GIY-YIG domain-containing protein n=1 Tax=Xenopus laevis TaxID=8355 RepID=A0A974DML9_XENLA|nr:hypothetical protein XELAEV_18011593mg [Xenopus laevis]